MLGVYLRKDGRLGGRLSEINYYPIKTVAIAYVKIEKQNSDHARKWPNWKQSAQEWPGFSV